MNLLDEVVSRVRKEMRVRGDSVPVDENSTLEELGLSSLQVAEVIFGLEEDLGVHLDEERAAQVKTLGELVNLFSECSQQGAGEPAAAAKPAE